MARNRSAPNWSTKFCAERSPADIPVEQPTKFDLFINLTNAKALGLAREDEVIE